MIESMSADTNTSPKQKGGWWSLSPLAVFLCLYLITSLLINDFYKVPITVAFLLSSCYAIAITRGLKLEQRIYQFSVGAGNKNILLMIWIFVLAGAFAQSAKQMGAIDATVNLTLHILPDNLLLAGIFIAACFISLSIGMLVYFLLIRPLLTERRDGEIRYRSLWPAWLSLEESVYKPLFRWLIRVLMTLCRVACDLLDLLVLVMRRTLLRDTRDHVRRSPHSSVVRAMSHNSKYSQEETADHVGTVLDTFQRMEGSLSFALLMACLGLCLILLCVILHVFG